MNLKMVLVGRLQVVLRKCYEGRKIKQLCWQARVSSLSLPLARLFPGPGFLLSFYDGNMSRSLPFLGDRLMVDIIRQNITWPKHVIAHPGL